jgi:hypothetical protein
MGKHCEKTSPDYLAFGVLIGFPRFYETEFNRDPFEKILNDITNKIRKKLPLARGIGW